MRSRKDPTELMILARLKFFTDLFQLRDGLVRENGVKKTLQNNVFLVNPEFERSERVGCQSFPAAKLNRSIAVFGFGSGELGMHRGPAGAFLLR